MSLNVEFLENGVNLYRSKQSSTELLLTLKSSSSNNNKQANAVARADLDLRSPWFGV